MKRYDIENGLALLAALVVLIGVSSAATSAFAAEPETAAIAARDAGDVTVKAAAKANKRSAADAARSIARDNLVSLDIELEDRISTLVAGTK